MTTLADPARTTVLAIGIERYGDLPKEWLLPGVADQAVEIARWAHEQHHIPKARIYLGCEWVNRPLIDPVTELGVQRAGTDSDGLFSTIKQIEREAGDLLLVFWCGHGATTDGIDRRLFSSNAQLGSRTNISVDGLRRRLAASTTEDGSATFASQILLIDACANPLDPKVPSPVGWETSDDLHPPQDLYFSTGLGYVAAVDPVTGAPRYSSAVLRWLASPAHRDFPPDFARLAKDMRSQLAATQDAYTGRPVHIYIRTRDEVELIKSLSADLTASEARQLAAYLRASRAMSAGSPVDSEPAAATQPQAGEAALRIRVLRNGQPVSWKEKLRVDVATRSTTWSGVTTDVNGIAEFGHGEVGPVVVTISRVEGGTRLWALAPIRAVTHVPTVIDVDLTTLPNDAWDTDPLPAGIVPVWLDGAEEPPSVRPSSERHAPWGLPRAEFVFDGPALAVGMERGWGIPRWVASRLRPGAMGPRPDRFTADPRMPQELRISPSAYVGTGWDRGALISWLDIGGYGPEAAQSAFHMSVIAPQHPETNRKTWLQLEQYTRSIAELGEVFAISGPVFAVDGNGFSAPRFGDPPVLVPDGFFRILIRSRDGSPIPETLAFLVANEPAPYFTLADAQSTITQIESLTGLQFFEDAPDTVRPSMLSRSVGDLWAV